MPGQRPSDFELIRRFAQDGCEEAFCAVVDRHGGLVYSACCRWLGDHHLAEDAAQATFIVLARKAGKLGEKTVLADWLYKTARYVVLQLKRETARRTARERKAGEEAARTAPSHPARDVAWGEVRPILDEEIVHLPKASRQAVLLHYLEGRSLEETAQALKITPDAARMRVNYGVEKLRARLVRRGVTPSVLALTAFLTTNTAEAAPAALGASLHTAAMQTAGPAASAGATASAGAAASAHAAASAPNVLAEGAIQAMAWAKIKTAVISVVLTGALVAGGWHATRSLSQRASGEPASPDQTPAASPAVRSPDIPVWDRTPQGAQTGVSVPRPSDQATTGTVDRPPLPPATDPALAQAEDAPLPPLPKTRETAPAGAHLAALTANVNAGALRYALREGTIETCPLAHTDIQAEISGFLARVRVTQSFQNPLDEAIEAVYVFPLPHRSAVDRMTLLVGERRIRGVVRERKQARAIYAAAAARGKRAALLEQQRSNVFVQSVANIAPGETVRVEISYVDTLPYADGAYEWHVPLAIAPRYTPAGAQPLPGHPAPPASRAPDALSLRADLDAGLEIRAIESPTHAVTTTRPGPRYATIRLAAGKGIPNRDFVLRYRLAGDQPQAAVLAHTNESGQGHMLLLLQPALPRGEDESPRDFVFLIDASGSMQGQKLAQARALALGLLARCRPGDRIQTVRFSGAPKALFPKSMPATSDTLAKARTFVRNLEAEGGTEMLSGVRAALKEATDPERVRIVVMLTDGQVTNESEILSLVQKHCKDTLRFWCIGVGDSPNRFLTGSIARQGRGLGRHLAPGEDSQALVREAMKKLRRAQLASIRIDWGEATVYETYPIHIPDLCPEQPILISGLYEQGMDTTVTVHGTGAGKPVAIPIDVTLPEEEPAHDALAQVWARHCIEDLLQSAAYAPGPAVREEVTGLAIDYQIMSPYTSFVAVDETDLREPAKPARTPKPVQVFVPAPAGRACGEEAKGWLEGALARDAVRESEQPARPGHDDAASERKLREPREYVEAAQAELLREARHHLDMRHFRKAERITAKALALDPNNAEAIDLLQRIRRARRSWRERKIRDREQEERRRVLEKIERRAVPEVRPEYLMKYPANWEILRKRQKRQQAHAQMNEENTRAMHDAEVNWTLEVPRRAILPSEELVYPEDWERIERRVARTRDAGTQDALPPEVQRRLDKRLTMHLEDARLEDALQFLSQRTGLEFVLPDETLASQRVSLSVRQMRAENIVKWLAAISEGLEVEQIKMALPADWDTGLRRSFLEESKTSDTGASADYGSTEWNAGRLPFRCDGNHDIKLDNRTAARSHLRSLEESTGEFEAGPRDDTLPDTDATYCFDSGIRVPLEYRHQWFDAGARPDDGADTAPPGAHYVSSLRDELADLKARAAALESSDMAPAAGGDADTLTSMKQRGAIKIGGDVAVDVVVRDRDEPGSEDGVSSTHFESYAVGLDFREADAELRRLSERNHELAMRTAELETLLGKAREQGFNPRMVRKGFVGSPTPAGRVLQVDEALGRVVLGLGRKDGVRTGMEFVVSRGDRYIGKVRVRNVYDELCSATVLQDLTREPVQTDDVAQCMGESSFDTGPAQPTDTAVAAGEDQAPELPPLPPAATEAADTEAEGEARAETPAAARPSNRRHWLGVLAESRARDLAALQRMRRQAMLLAERIHRTDARLRELLVAPQALEQAAACADKGDLLAARAFLTRALLMCQANQAIGRRDERLEQAARKGLQQVEADLRERWTGALPALGNELDLAIRNQGLAHALQAVGRAGNVPVTLTPGSVEDAEALLGRARLRVPFLDLSGLTVAEGLDALLNPFRLHWRVADGGVTAESARRGPRPCAWVYDVSLLVTPTPDEVGQAGSPAEIISLTRQAMDTVAFGVQKALKLEEGEIVWFDGGQLLVWGDRTVHAHAAGLLERLADPAAGAPGALTDLQAHTAERFQAREAAAAERRAAQETERIRKTLEETTWALLASSAGDAPDEEAFWRTAACWSRPGVRALLQGPQRLTALRSAWVVCTSAALQPKDSHLTELKRRVQAHLQAAEDALLAASAASAAERLGLLYAALARPAASGFRARALKRIRQGADAKDAVAGLAAVYAEDGGRRQAMARMLSGNLLAQTDALVLVAFAAKERGPETWEDFRKKRSARLKAGNVPDTVAVLLHRLDRRRLPE